jgi:hypothetical protein
VTGTAAAALGFALLAVSAVVLDAAARRRPDLPSAGRSVAAAMRTTPGRVAVLAAWLWIGVHFLAR